MPVWFFGVSFKTLESRLHLLMKAVKFSFSMSFLISLNCLQEHQNSKPLECEWMWELHMDNLFMDSHENFILKILLHEQLSMLILDKNNEGDSLYCFESVSLRVNIIH